MFFDENAFRQRLKALRRNEGVTQEELADRISVSANYVAKIETGLRAPTIDVLIQLSVCFRVSLDFLILGHHTKEKSLEEKALALAEELTEFALAKKLSNNMDT